VGSRSALELASLAYLAVLRAQPGVAFPDPDLAVVLAPLLDANGTLVVSPDLHDDMAHELVCLLRNQFARRPRSPDGALDLAPLQQAYRIIVDPRLEPTLLAALDEQPYRTDQYVDLVETRVSLFSTLLHVLHRPGEPPDQAEGAAQIVRVSAGSALPIAGLDELFATLDRVEALLRDGPGLAQRFQQDPFTRVVLAKVALQRGMLLLHGRGERQAAAASFATAMELAEQFERAPYREKRAFKRIIDAVSRQHGLH
jgi:hypothetical protein